MAPTTFSDLAAVSWLLITAFLDSLLSCALACDVSQGCVEAGPEADSFGLSEGSSRLCLHPSEFRIGCIPRGNTGARHTFILELADILKRMQESGA
jgi:hypothetical protein